MAEAIAQICRTCRGEGMVSHEYLCFGVDVDKAAEALAKALITHRAVQEAAYECGDCDGKGFRRGAGMTRPGDGGHAQGSGVADEGEGALND